MRQDSDDNLRLLRAFDQLPKTIHSTDVFKRHPEVRPEWIMRIIEDPYDEWVETDASGRISRVVAGRVEDASQWIKVILSAQGRLVTAHFDHHLEDRFGGRPWTRNQ